MPFTPEQQREFTALIHQYQPSLRAYIISLMPGISGASDVLQETNIVLWEKREQFKLGTNFLAWSFTVAKFQVKAHLNKALKRQRHHRTLDEDLANELAEFCANDPQESDLRLKALDHCFSLLKDNEKELVKHRYMNNSNLAAYANKIGTSENTLSVALHRIRQKLRDCINSTLKKS